MHKVTSSDGGQCGIMKVLLHQALSLCDHSLFANEAISLSRLQHPCLTPVLSCGLSPLNVVWQAAHGCSAMEHMDRFAPSRNLLRPPSGVTRACLLQRAGERRGRFRRSICTALGVVSQMPIFLHALLSRALTHLAAGCVMPPSASAFSMTRVLSTAGEACGCCLCDLLRT